MRAVVLITVGYVLVQALSLTAAASARAEPGPEAAPAIGALPWEKEAPADRAATKSDEAPTAEVTSVEPDATPAAAPEPADDTRPEPAAEKPATGTGAVKAEDEPVVDAAAEKAALPKTTEPVPPAPPHPVVAIIRETLADSDLTKDAEEEDVEALQAFYGARSAPPLWITEMGFSAKGQAVLFEIQKADAWGLEPEDFALPDAGILPADETAQAVAEIKLDLAVLKYARFARGARHVPSEISDLFDQAPTLRAPGTVMAEMGTTGAPDIYLQSLHPDHQQFARLRMALREAREAEKPNETDIRRLVINMERWRWMPEELGELYVWLNTPEFMLYVVKDGETIFEDKTLVGTIGYATPVFSADLETVVFNPDWVAPPSVLRDKLWPALKRKHYSILTANKLNVSYRGKRIDPARVNWQRVNIHNFTFSQKSGPKNVLGKAKFLYPNKHIVYMHDTLPYRRKVFDEKVRAIGYGCVRMAKPLPFAELMLAEDQELPKTKVKTLWDKGVNSPVTLETKPPVHTTYFTVVVDEEGKVATFKDLYGLDRKHAMALFGETDGFPLPPPEPKPRSSTVASSSPSSRGSGGGGFANSLGFND